MRLLINITDVRKYKQIGKQINADSFNGHVRTVQENQLTELLGKDLSYALFDYLNNNWTLSGETFERVSDTEIKAINVDLSGWNDYSIRLNKGLFLIAESANFDGTDTILTVTGNNLSNTVDEYGVLQLKYVPDTITSVEHKVDNSYTLLLNGDEAENYNGLRPFLSWHFAVSYLVDGSLKQNDVGNINVTGDLFQKAGKLHCYR